MISRKNYFYICCIILFSPIHGCPSFNNVIHSLPYISSPNSKCVSDKECTSVNCTITDQSLSSVGLVLKSCDQNPLIEIHANIPAVGINNWSATFTDSSEHIIPGYFLPSTNDKLQGYLRTEMTILPESEILMLSITMKGCENKLSSPIFKKILHDQYIDCNVKYPSKKPCLISYPFQCSETETCRQILQTQRGLCECLPGYSRSPEGSCTMITPVAFQEYNQTSLQDSVKKTGDNVVVNLIVPMVLLVLFISLVLASYKFGWIRRKCRPQSFQVITNNDPDPSDDDDLPLAL